MRIIGIDPGFATIGFGVVDYNHNKFTYIDHGTIQTPAKTPFEDRLEQIYDELTRAIAYYHAEEAAVEELFFNTNITTGIQVAHGRGVILLSIVKSRIPFYEYTPQQVKQAVVGYGKAEKRQVMAMTKMLLNLQQIPRPDDAADALALAICHGQTVRF